MAISDETGPDDSVTELTPALKLFTDRREAIRLFAEYLNDDPPRERILFFHGDGGNGKTLLLNYLRGYFCKRLRRDNWEYVKVTPEDDFDDHFKLAEGAQAVPSVLVDFGVAAGEYRPQDALSALLMMRRSLAGHGLRFPLFDFAGVWYLHKTGGLSEGRLSSLFPAEELDFIAEIVDAVGNTSWGALSKVLLNIFSKHTREWFSLYRRRRQLDEEQVEAIQRMDPEKELVAQLPYLFAGDLNASLALHEGLERIVLFFDTHESFWGSEKRDLSADQYFKADEWLRRLLKTLELSAGVVVVMAGRDRPRWAEASRAKIPDRFLDTQLVGHLSVADSESYLERAGVEDAGMRASLITFASVAPDQVHPFYLGLLVDIVAAAARKGARLTARDFRRIPQAADKEQELLDRLLRYVDEDVHFAIRALSACRVFDREIYFKLGAALAFHATEPSFQVLTRFSFVWRTERGGEGRYRIHDLLRRLLRERQDEVVARADAVLEQYHRERGGEFGVVESIYHANRAEPERGVEEWSLIFKDAQNQGRFQLCRSLLELRGELLITTEFGRGLVLVTEGIYHASLSQNDEARRDLLGAISAFDAALAEDPGHPVIHQNKGIALQSVGLVEAGMSHNSEAAERFREAIACFDDALSRDPDLAIIHSNKGAALKSLGDLQTAMSRYGEAAGEYRHALGSLDAALRLEPDTPEGNFNRGLTLQSLGFAHYLQANYEEAAASYEESISSLDTAIRVAPNFILAHTSKGVTLQTLAEVYLQLWKPERAIESYKGALSSFDAALALAPDSAITYATKGTSLRGLGDLYALLQRNEEAAASYEEGIVCCDTSLSLGPDVSYTYIQKGLTLRSHGMLLGLMGDFEGAVVRCKEALAALDAALRLAPDFAYAHTNRGLTLHTMGDAQIQQKRYEEASESFTGALVSLDTSIRLAPDFALAHTNRAMALRGLGQARANLSLYETAAAALGEALAAADTALRLAPDLAPAHTARGSALTWVGIVEAEIERPESAIEKWHAALESFSRALEIAPGNAWIEGMRSIAQQCLDTYAGDGPR